MLKQAINDCESRSKASFGAAVQLSVGPRRYPSRATQESSSFQEIRDLHLTPARFRSSGRLCLRSARYWLELLVLLPLSVSVLAAVGSRSMERGRSDTHTLKPNGYLNRELEKGD